MQNMKEVTRYQCQYCKKDYKTPFRHRCRHNPDLKNCYSCEHWLHRFVINKTHNLLADYKPSCKPEETCMVNSDYAGEAFYIMCNRGWRMDCPNWKYGG